MKEKLLHELIERTKKELTELEAAALAQSNFATDQEFKSEGKYDTRSLEASYLASAENRRVEELKGDLEILEGIDLRVSEESRQISIGALIELEHNKQSRKYFLTPTAGGTILKDSDEAILVISVFSPLGDALLGLKTGDEFEIETPKEMRFYKVISFS